MSRVLRTTIAFLVAPVVAPVVAAVVALWWAPPFLVGDAWTARAARCFYLTALVSYPLSYTVGTLTFLVLWFAKRESIWAYSIFGGGAGFFYAVMFVVRPGYDLDRIAARLFLALLGVLVAASFALLRGRKPEPNPESYVTRSRHITLVEQARGGPGTKPPAKRD